MAVKRPKVVIIGAGMAGVTAAHRLYTAGGGVKESLGFDVCVVEGGGRIGGRINTREFVGDGIEMGATWIHGIGGSPVYEIARKIGSLDSEKSWECMDGLHDDRLSMAETRTEGGFVVNPAIVEPISSLFDGLMSFAQGKCENGENGDVGVEPISSLFDSLMSFAHGKCENGENGDVGVEPNSSLFDNLMSSAQGKCENGSQMSSIGSFLKLGIEKFRGCKDDNGEEDGTVCGDWSRKMLEEAIFAVYENTQRTYTGAGDLFNLDYAAESEYRMFPGDEITIPRGYITVVEALASVLPPGLIQLGRKVVKIEWQQQNGDQFTENGENGDHSYCRPVKLHFSDGSVMTADHVIVTVSLGVLKAAISDDFAGLGLGLSFSPPLPSSKKEAISRLGFGVVNKLFLELTSPKKTNNFPFMQMAFHRSDSKFKDSRIPWWMRRTASIYPIHNNSTVLLSWFAGKEALQLESLDDTEIIDGVSTTVSNFTSTPDNSNNFEFKQILRSKWGTDPLFLGSYSYVSVGSSGDDFDTLAQPLPMENGLQSQNPNLNPNPLQILFAGEATHRTHYSTTHGAYFSGLREANRLLQQYNLNVE